MKAQRLFMIFSVMLALFGYKNYCYATEYQARQTLQDMDLPGNTFRSFPLVVDDDFSELWGAEDFRSHVLLPAAYQCKDDCNNDSRCLAWTYKFYGYRKLGELEGRGFAWFRIQVRGECFLKDRVPSVVPKMMHFSGVKPPLPPPPSTSRTVAAMEYNTDRPGGDYRKVSKKKIDAKYCQTICMSDSRCKAWTYVKPNKLQGEEAQCWLKDSVPRKIQNSRCVSGVK